MIHYHMEKTQPMIKDGEKSPNSRVYLQKLEQHILVQSWQKYFKIPAGLTNTDREGSEKSTPRDVIACPLVRVKV